MMSLDLKKRLQNLGILIILVSGSLTTFNKSIIALNLDIEKNNLSKYIGLRYSNYQKNDLLQDLSANGGNIIGNSSSVYSLAEFWDKESDRVIIFFEKIISKNREGQSKYQILDAIGISLKEYDVMAVFSEDSNYQGNYRLIRFGCSVGDRPDPELIAIVKNEPNVKHFRNIKKAWRANIKTQKIAEISSKSISCENIYPSAGEIP